MSVCPRCSGRMLLREVAVTAEAITRVLARHELWPRPPPPAQVRRWVDPAQVALRFT